MTNTRQQIADMLKYLPKKDRRARAKNANKAVDSWLHYEGDAVSVAQVLEDNPQYSTEDLYIGAESYCDHDGFDCIRVVITVKEKVSDEDYFEQVSNLLVSYQHLAQWQQYKNYLKMKLVYEGEI